MDHENRRWCELPNSHAGRSNPSKRTDQFIIMILSAGESVCHRITFHRKALSWTTSYNSFPVHSTESSSFVLMRLRLTRFQTNCFTDDLEPPRIEDVTSGYVARTLNTRPQRLSDIRYIYRYKMASSVDFKELKYFSFGKKICSDDLLMVVPPQHDDLKTGMMIAHLNLKLFLRLTAPIL
uniref:Uncharacterized protein n=1 Tax=Timema poppense TaxID=170557 RepID=A0A7R9H1Q2_TIMPO|nr:unnamed protein product [Timema poppensis]